MDYYVQQFYSQKGNCTVCDYAVFLEKKEGFSRFNPFSAYEQLVIYRTDKGMWYVQVGSSGEFSAPVKAEDRLTTDGEKLVRICNGKTYKFCRKWVDGNCGSPTEFLSYIAHKV